jgi:hypothetical protein
MAANVADSVIDNGLASLKTAARYVWITTQECTTYAEASSTYAKGSKDLGAGNVFPGAIAAGTNGRKVTTAAITDGAVSGDGTVNNWAITDGSALLAVGALSAGQAVVNGNTFSLGAFDITIKKT